MTLHLLVVIGLLLSGMLASDAPAPVISIPDLRAEDLPRWRDHIRLAPAERAFDRIDWIPTFHQGIRAADARQRPLLFWAMNGHPLGCT